MNMEQNTKHAVAARSTQIFVCLYFVCLVDRLVESKAYTRHKLMETGKQRKNMREGESGVSVFF